MERLLPPRTRGGGISIHRRRLLGFMAIGWACAFLAGCSIPPDNPSIAAPDKHTTAPVAYVDIVNQSGRNQFGFAPGTLTVRAGTRVIWRNRSSQAHTVTDTAASRAFDSGTYRLIGPGQHWSFVFHSPGRYVYTCLLHPFMRGTIVVR